MMLTAEVEASTVSVHVLDATPHFELAALRNIPVAITM